MVVIQNEGDNEDDVGGDNDEDDGDDDDEDDEDDEIYDDDDKNLSKATASSSVVASLITMKTSSSPYS